jgi:hypothetical protein
MDEVSRIRQEWKTSWNNSKKNVIESPHFLPWNLPKKMSPKIPAELKKKLNAAFYQSMSEFATRLSNKMQ